jgi:hypothetical protein
MSAKTAEQTRNEQPVHRLYSLADGKSKDTPTFVSQFAGGGYFFDVGAGKKYYRKDIGLTVDIYAAAVPDMHRELYAAGLGRVRLPSANELTGVRYQGRKITEVASRLHG